MTTHYLCILSLFILIAYGQYSPLPDCQAIAPSGHFFNWTQSIDDFIQINTKYFIASICGMSVYPCESTRCAFCQTGTYKICDGFNFEGQKGRWYATGPLGGAANFPRNDRGATIKIVCNASAEKAIIKGGDKNYPYELTYISKRACPIGVCPGGCGYASGWGTCHPLKDFSCTCNVGFTGNDCLTPSIGVSYTKTTGPYQTGYIAGGQTWIAWQFFDEKGTLIPCSASLNSGLSVSASCTKDSWRNYTINGYKAGIFKLEVSLFKTPLKGSPFVYIVSPGLPDPLKAEASGEGLTTAKVGATTKFQIQLMDKYKNEIKSCPFDNGYNGSLYGTSNVDVSFSCSNGTMTGAYVVKLAGPYQLLVRYKDNLAPGFPTGVTASE
jgi:hypothetical protein